MSDELHERIVQLAISAAGVADRGWLDRVNALVPRIGALFQPPRDDEDPTSAVVTARKVVEAHSFKAVYNGHDHDENTQRIFVKIFDPDRDADEYTDTEGNQVVRTEPMWAASGRAVREILNGMEVGQPAVFYRYSEPIEGGRKKMGVLVHVEPRRRRQNAGSGAPRTAPSSQRQAAPESPPVSGAADSDYPVLVERVEQLDNRQKVAYMHATRAEGINGMAPGDDQLDRALVLLGEIEKGDA